MLTLISSQQERSQTSPPAVVRRLPSGSSETKRFVRHSVMAILTASCEIKLTSGGPPFMTYTCRVSCSGLTSQQSPLYLQTSAYRRRLMQPPRVTSRASRQRSRRLSKLQRKSEPENPSLDCGRVSLAFIRGPARSGLGPSGECEQSRQPCCE